MMPYPLYGYCTDPGTLAIFYFTGKSQTCIRRIFFSREQGSYRFHPFTFSGPGPGRENAFLPGKNRILPRSEI